MPIANPLHVRFVPSTDHATVTRYDLRDVVVATSAASAPLDIGVPTPAGGFCTVDLDTAGWDVDTEYRVEVRSVRGTETSAWVASSNTGEVESDLWLASSTTVLASSTTALASGVQL